MARWTQGDRASRRILTLPFRYPPQESLKTTQAPPWNRRAKSGILDTQQRSEKEVSLCSTDSACIWAISAVSPPPEPGRSARRTPEAKRDGRPWAWRAPAPTLPATSGRAGRSLPRWSSQPGRPTRWPTSRGRGRSRAFGSAAPWGGTSSCAFTGTGRRGRRWKRRSPTFSPFSGRIRTRTAPPGGSPPCNPCRCWWPPTGDTTAFGKCRSVSGAASRWRTGAIRMRSCITRSTTP